jgi:hypothetical protein
VPPLIPAWKGKAALREAGLLDAVETAVLTAGGRIADAWTGASEWRRDSDFLLSLATGLGLTEQHVNDNFLGCGCGEALTLIDVANNCGDRPAGQHPAFQGCDEP